MRVVITGGGGQLARELARSAPHNIEVHSLERATCDITDVASIDAAFAEYEPDIVINAAAYTAVDRAESESELAFPVNETGAGNVARACADANARLIHVSTDYVFDGRRSTPYPVDAEPSPLGVYGRSKLAGERAVRNSTAAFTILRCGWLYSAAPGNFLTTMLGKMRQGDALRVVDDEVGVPTAAGDVASVIWWCAATWVAQPLLHWTPTGKASRYEFALAIQELGLELGLLTTPSSLVAVKSSEYPTAAERPRYSVLDASDTWRLMGAEPPDWRSPLRIEMTAMQSANDAEP